MAVPVGIQEAIIFITMKTRARSQALPATIIIMKTRVLLANAGNSSLKMAALESRFERITRSMATAC